MLCEGKKGRRKKEEGRGIKKKKLEPERVRTSGKRGTLSVDVFATKRSRLEEPVCLKAGKKGKRSIKEGYGSRLEKAKGVGRGGCGQKSK